MWTEESQDLNAYAAAGHTVGVSRFALENLPSAQLAAVLAHELGHHTGGHAWSLTARLLVLAGPQPATVLHTMHGMDQQARHQAALAAGKPVAEPGGHQARRTPSHNAEGRLPRRSGVGALQFRRTPYWLYGP
ncbi:M48 family metalloprotease [Streptomyces mesophilus]|uniref:M48 family metalloprotease n=1 Tax=Streptomyces mesophilus TaxID=1775132 RepID=UPI001F37A371|nr:M48 family metalloprotease [Streptomyces mesophilus]